MKLRQIALYFCITVGLIYCTPSTPPTEGLPPTSPDPAASEKAYTEAALSTTYLKSTDKLTLTMTTQVSTLIAADRAAQAKDITSLSNQLVTLNLSNADRDKKLAAQSLTITTLQTQNKSLQDSLNAYKKSADLAIFKTVNGVLTIPYFLDIKAYLIKIGAIKP